MSEKKHIDKLFQEKFKDFETDPPEFTWPELKERLEKKNKKRIIPFWWKLSGIAAAFVIGFFVVKNIPQTKTADQNTVVVNPDNNPSENPSHLIPKQTHSESIAVAADDPASAAHPIKIPTSENNKNSVANSEETSENAVLKKEKPSNSIAGPNPKITVASRSENASPDGENPENLNGKSKNPILRNQKKSGIQIGKSNSYENTKTAVAHSETQKPKRSVPEKRNDQSKLKNAQTAVAESGSYSNLKSNRKNKSNPKNQNSEITLLRNEITRNLNTNQALANENTTDLRLSETNKFSDLPTGEKENTVAASEEKEPKKTDSTAVAVVPNALEELLKEKQKVAQKEPKLNRWQLTSSVAPVYLGSTSQGSPIDSSFAGNSKDYGTNLSFGLGVNYAVSKKLKIRTGINKVSLSYRTNDVYINAGLQAKALPNVTIREQNQSLNLSSSASKANTASEFSTDTFQSYLNQKMGYIEVPVELSYAIIDKRFGIDLIAGLSTLFLNENEIQIVSSGFTTDFGEANNLNKTHFSTNVGLGLKYRFFNAFEANFNPMFKYQMDTFSKDNGNFKPYFFGLYTGLSFKF